MLMTGAIELPAAQEKVLGLLKPLPTRRADGLHDACDHVLAEPVLATRDLPQAPTSIVDGFAISTADLDADTKTTAFSIKRQRVDGAAGAAAPQEGLRPKEAAYVTTGALLPPGADAVRPIEESDTAIPETVKLTPCERGKWVRWPGSDMKAGALILPAGHRLTPWDLSALAAAGVVRPKVVRKPVVAVLSTGRELLDPHGDAQELPADRIFDANRHMLMNMVKSEGMEVVDMGIASDDFPSIRKALADAAEKADVVVCTGGVSEGEFDFVRPVLRELAELQFDKVIMKPGKPATCAVRSGALAAEEGATSQPQAVFFGLPGNPASAAVTFQLLVVPVLQRLAGRPSHGKPVLPVRAEERVVADPQRPEWIRVSLRSSGEDMVAMHTGLQRSSRAASLAGASALLPLGAGEVVEAGNVTRAMIVGPLPATSCVVQAPQHKLETEAFTFRRVVEHFQSHVEVQNIDVMNLAGFCRNCLSKWYMKAAGDSGSPMELDAARLVVYGMPYDEWKKKYQTAATAAQKAAFDARHGDHQTPSSTCCKPKDKAEAGGGGSAPSGLPAAATSTPEMKAWEAAAFRKLLAHLRDNAQVPDEDLLKVAGFGRSSLIQWYQEASFELGCPVDRSFASLEVHGVAAKPPASSAPPSQGAAPASAVASRGGPKHSDVCTGGGEQGRATEADKTVPITSVHGMNVKLRVGVLTVSDRASKGTYEDLSGPAVVEALKAGLATLGVSLPEAIRSVIVPDEREALEKALCTWCDGDERVNLILTTGGTGFAPRDITPEVTRGVLEKESLGLAMAALQAGAASHPMAMVSRLVAGSRGRTVILNLPGSPKGAAECLSPIVPLLVHAVALCDSQKLSSF